VSCSFIASPLRGANRNESAYMLCGRPAIAPSWTRNIPPARELRQMSGVNEIRANFLAYFAREGHEVVPSSPLVPRNDPTLMFTNAGMVQFKNLFTGLEKRPYTRAVTAQKCVRAGGKHNDLDNVGYTARHHTFFEMLGNFSFGDYFKERAIELAWRLVTKEFGVPADRLVVTVYIDDDEAFNLWKKIAGLPESRIGRIAGSDNFWAMGDTGPCGPCSEIFYDHGAHIPGGPPGSPDADGDRFVEIWNLVFMQYEQLAGGERVALPRPSIDTGMGLERIAAVLQGTHDNYKIDLFGALIEAVADATGVDAEGARQASHRVIADHLRASAFLIADGVLPSNEGRGYVLRRIMRRAMRHAELLGEKEPLMWRLVPVLVREMGVAYPELQRAEPLITETLKFEETRFRRTLERGLAILDEESKGLKRRHVRRRHSLHALRHVRLSARSHPGRAQAARHRCRSRRVHRRHGAPARKGASVVDRLRRSGGRSGMVHPARGRRWHRFPRL
jgi:alanyl-tRNA synthetase